MSYSETIAALKDFTAAQRRLDEATKRWDDYRYALSPQFDPETGQRTFFFVVKSEFIGEIAQEFLSARNAYQRLGSAESDIIAKELAQKHDADVARDITSRFLERSHSPVCLKFMGGPCFCFEPIEKVDEFDTPGGICELGS